MEFRNLGKSGLLVSVVGLGCNNFGSRVDADGAQAVVNQCIEAGITFFDTADMYGGGKSEEFLGKALKPHRHGVVIATKVGASTGQGPYSQGASRKYLIGAVENSLYRLGTDYIDLLQIDFPDPRTPIQETLLTLDILVRAGKVRYIGNSNFSGWQVGEADWIGRTEHLTRFISAQNEYNLLQRTIETDLLPASQRYGLGLLPFHPLASGFLTGKYRPNQPPPEGSRLSSGSRSEALNEGNFEKLTSLERFAESHGHTLLELAFSWLAGHPSVSSIIAGATKPEQVIANASAVAWKLTKEDYVEIDRLLQGS